MAAIPSRMYDFTLSTQQNWKAVLPAAGGVYEAVRRRMDTAYHGHYKSEREWVQDTIVRELTTAPAPATPHGQRPWLIFTAGPMGVGKSYSMNKLVKGLMRVTDAVVADPDVVRQKLPEYQRYVDRDRESAGALTQKEAGFVSEMVQRVGLMGGRSVIVEGSLRDGDAAEKMIQRARREHPEYRVAIVEVTAPEGDVLNRAAQRARKVPAALLRASLTAAPASARRLAPSVDLHLRVDNSAAVPTLLDPLPDILAALRAPLPAASPSNSTTQQPIAPPPRPPPLLSSLARPCGKKNPNDNKPARQDVDPQP